MHSWQLVAVLLALSGTLLLAPGCASRQPQPSTADYSGMERPARPIEEEQSGIERIGEIAVVVLAIAVIGALIALPIIFLL